MVRTALATQRSKYPADNIVVNSINDYKSDRTGGPRGQLAVHPAVGQFLLDNAACCRRPDGISSVDAFLSNAREHMSFDAAKNYNVRAVNGYLALPDCAPKIQEDILTGFRQALHTMRCLSMQSVPACGLAPSFTELSHRGHNVNLVYASAVPVETYLNRHQANGEFQTEVGRLFLVAQYYGALRLAVKKVLAGSKSPARVFLMPLGGGVFNNSFVTILMQYPQP